MCKHNINLETVCKALCCNNFTAVTFWALEILYTIPRRHKYTQFFHLIQIQGIEYSVSTCVYDIYVPFSTSNCLVTCSVEVLSLSNSAGLEPLIKINTISHQTYGIVRLSQPASARICPVLRKDAPITIVL